MPTTALSAHTLNRALSIAGSLRRLARELRVPSADLRLWLAGREAPPTGVFLDAVDIILAALEDESPRGIARPTARGEARI